MTNEKYSQERYENLVREQHKNFPSITLPSEYAELFHVNTLQVLIKLARYKFAARLLKKTDDLLEVGSGTGLGAMFLAQHTKRITGLEIREDDYCAACKISSSIKNISFLHQSIFDYDQCNTHDAIVSLDVIEHLNESEGRNFVAKLARHCNSAGMVIIGTPSIHSLPYQSKYSQAAHVKCYDQHELLALMDIFFQRTLAFSMNDEIVHTGHPKLAWYYFVIGLMPRPIN